MLLSTALAVDHALALLKSTKRPALLCSLIALFLVVAITRREPPNGIDISSGPRSYHEIYFITDPVHRAWMNMGMWAKNHFPAGTVIGCRDSGAVGYFAEDLTVVNLDGVVNFDAYEAMKAGRLLAYAHAVKIQYVPVWGELSPLRKEDLLLDRDLDFGSLGMQWHVYRLRPR